MQANTAIDSVYRLLIKVFVLYWIVLISIIWMCQAGIIPCHFWAEAQTAKYVVQILAVVKTMLAIINGHTYQEKRKKEIQAMPFDEGIKAYRHTRLKCYRIMFMLMMLDMVLFYCFDDHTAAFLFAIAAAQDFYFMPRRKNIQQVFDPQPGTTSKEQ